MGIPLNVVNQVFELQQKLASSAESANCERNFSRLFNLFEEEGLIIQNPFGEFYSESRTDCEASIIGEPAEKMKISKVLKPAIYLKENGSIQLVQKAVVIVEK
jgi:hypothetical protein